MTTETNGVQHGAMVGRKLGDYELVSILASGGMARIYKGFDSRLDRVAAVKVLMKELLESDDTLTERFEREAKAIARLEHPNIVPVYQFKEQDGYFFIAMKYVEGEDLADQLARMRGENRLMDVRRVFHIMEQVAAALDYAHRHDIVHRDVKPSNVLIDRDDHVYLTDFGLALWQSVNKTMGTAFGTPRYISPEQALASEKSVPQSDIYSLAVMMYEILTGDMLFRADTPMQIALYHINEPPPKPRSVNPDIPEAAENEILKALSKAPQKRHKSASEFINALKAAYADQLNSSAASIPPAISQKTLVLPPDDWREQVQTKDPTHSTAFARPTEWQVDSKRRSKTPLIIGLIVALVIAGIGAYLAFGGGLAALMPALTATTPPTQAAAVIVATPTSPPPLAGEPVTLEYNYTTLVLRNNAQVAIPLADVRLTRISANPQPFDASQVTGARLPAERCIVLIQSGRETSFDASDWGCASGSQGRIYWQTSVPGGGMFFWRVEGLDTHFEIYAGDQLAAVCPGVTRTDQTRNCTFTLPVE